MCPCDVFMALSVAKYNEESSAGSGEDKQGLGSLKKMAIIQT